MFGTLGQLFSQRKGFLLSFFFYLHFPLSKGNGRECFSPSKRGQNKGKKWTSQQGSFLKRAVSRKQILSLKKCQFSMIYQNEMCNRKISRFCGS